jgi:hypothetical protein
LADVLHGEGSNVLAILNDYGFDCPDQDADEEAIFVDRITEEWATDGCLTTSEMMAEVAALDLDCTAIVSPGPRWEVWIGPNNVGKDKTLEGAFYKAVGRWNRGGRYINGLPFCHMMRRAM